jgi:hypothetical protein
MAAFLVTVVKHSYTFSSSLKQFLRIAVSAGIYSTFVYFSSFDPLTEDACFSPTVDFCFTFVIVGIY